MFKLRKKMEHSSFTKYLLKKKLEGSQKRNGTIAPHSGGGSWMWHPKDVLFLWRTNAYTSATFYFSQIEFRVVSANISHLGWEMINEPMISNTLWQTRFSGLFGDESISVASLWLFCFLWIEVVSLPGSSNHLRKNVIVPTSGCIFEMSTTSYSFFKSY